MRVGAGWRGGAIGELYFRGRGCPFHGGGLLLILAALLVSPCWAQTEDLRIVLANPSGDRDALYSIDVTFSEPMVALGTRGKIEREGPIRLSPKLKGAFTWVGTTTASFLLEAPPPDGTFITCTVPKGTKALSGRRLASDYTWSIAYRRPALIAAIPSIPDTSLFGRRERLKLEAVHPPEDPILLAFDRPLGKGAAGRIELLGPAGRVPLTEAPVLPDYGRALSPRRDQEIPAERVLALRPSAPLESGATYTVRIPADLPFANSGLSLGRTLRYPFRTLEPLAIERVEGNEEALVFSFTSEVEPDSLLPYLRVTPDPGPMTASELRSSRQVVVRGRFPAGRRIQIDVRPGLHDAFGRSMTNGFSSLVLLPHARSLLELEPMSGVLLPGPQENVRFLSRNVGPVRLRAVWIPSSEMPLILQRERGSEPPKGWPKGPWETRWTVFPEWKEAAEHPDSAVVWQRLLTELGDRPADAQALLIEGTGLPLFEAASDRKGEEARHPLYARSVIQIATLGIHSRLGKDNGLLWVTDLLSGRPVPGARVALWDYPTAGGVLPKAPLWRGQTDADGIAWTPGRVALKRSDEILVSAESQNRRTWLPLSKDWDPEHDAPEDPNAGYIFTDRPIYRPGETIQWKAFIRRSEATSLHATPLRTTEVLLRGPEGAETVAQASINERGNANGEIELASGSLTGTYQLALRRPGQQEYQSIGSTFLEVQAYRAPRFQARVEGLPTIALSGSPARFSGRFAYFSGPPLAGLPVRWYLYREPLYWQPPNWDPYTFQDQPSGGRWTNEAWRGPEVVREGELSLDPDGRFQLELPLSLPPEAGDATFTFEAGARDLTDQSAFGRDRIQVLRGPMRPGVQALWSDDETQGEGRWSWTVVDTAGHATPGTPATLELIYREWKTVRLRRVGGIFEYENTARDSVLSVVQEASPDSARTLTVPIPRAGYYLLRVTVREPDGTSLSAAAGRHFSGPQTAALPRNNVQWIAIEADRRIANPNDTLHVIVPAPAGGAEGLMVLESGGVLAAEHRHLEGTPRVPVPLHEAAPQDVHISAVLVGPDRVPMRELKAARQDYPYFARGSTSVEISREPWRAKVEVVPDQPVLEPGGTLGVEIRLTGPDGRPRAGEVALAVVDEAVLALVEGPDPDPLSGLFAWRGSGTQVEDTRNLLRLSAPLGEKGRKSPGGSGAEGGGARLRTLFKATAYWNPSIVVGEDGRARVSFPLPDELTRYRLRATAALAGESFGFADAQVQVNKPLMVEPAAPRFVRAGDAWILGAVVQNRSGEILPVKVTCRVEGGALTGPSESQGEIRPGETRRFDFPVRVKDAGTVRYTLEARAAGAAGEIFDGLQRTLDASYPLDRITEVAFGIADPQAEERVRLDDPGLAGTGGLTARVAATLLSDLNDAADYLITYPHACLEQIDARLLGLLTRLELADRLPPDSLSADELRARLSASLAQIEAYRTETGFTLWPGSGSAEMAYPYLDGYTLWILGSLRAAGLDVPEPLLSEASRFVHEHLAQEQAEIPSETEGWMERGERVRGRSEFDEGSEGRFTGAPLDPDTRVFLTWVLLESEGSGAVSESDLERLFARREPLGSAGLLSLSLCWETLARSRPKDASFQRMVRTRIAGMLEAALTGADQTAQFLAVHEKHPGWGESWNADPGDRVRSTTLAVLLLSRHDANHQLLPSLVSWLLEQRRHGRWGNTHENAFALQALREYAARVETLNLPMQGQVTAGLAEPKRFRFESGALQPASFDLGLEELTRTQRLDPRSSDIPLHVEVTSGGRAYYQLRMDRIRPALGLPPQEEGLIVSRAYVSPADGTERKKLTRGEPSLVHLTLVVPHDWEYLALEDPLPAGMEAVNLRLRTAGQFQFAAATQRGARAASAGTGAEAFPGSRPGSMLVITHRDLLDDRVRFYADRVPAGVYHIYYPVTPTTAGEFGVPGTRAELLYSPEIYGSSGATVVKIE